MGNGKRLKEILNEKNIRISELAKKTKINNKTLYQIISRDSNISVEDAVKIAIALNINIAEILDIDASDIIYQSSSRAIEYGQFLSEKLKGDPVLLFEKSDFPEIEKLLHYYFILNDTGREEVRNYIKYQLTQNKDKEREKKSKTIIK